MSKKNKIEMLEETLDRKLTVAEMYANRPRKWLLYTAIVLIIAVLIGWSANDIHFTGLTATGTEVAKGVVHGVFHPDTDLMFGSGDSDVPYLLLQTIAIAVLGTLFGAILAIPFAFLASFNIMPKPVAYVVRVLILMIRTIPSIVWALMWIRVTGPGAACGVITQSVCSIGMISKMYITDHFVSDKTSDTLDTLTNDRRTKMTYMKWFCNIRSAVVDNDRLRFLSCFYRIFLICCHFLQVISKKFFFNLQIDKSRLHNFCHCKDLTVFQI
mgnify:CR=1 FL=1